MYVGICANDGINIPDVEAFDSFIEILRSSSDEDKREFVEWFASGNWIHEED